MILRRLGKAPQERAGACTACNNCPDVFETPAGDFAVIGREATAELSRHLPADAGCGAGERIVLVPREVMLAAWEDFATVAR